MPNTAAKKRAANLTFEGFYCAAVALMDAASGLKHIPSESYVLSQALVYIEQCKLWTTSEADEEMIQGLKEQWATMRKKLSQHAEEEANDLNELRGRVGRWLGEYDKLTQLIYEAVDTHDIRDLDGDKLDHDVVSGRTGFENFLRLSGQHIDKKEETE